MGKMTQLGQRQSCDFSCAEPTMSTSQLDLMNRGTFGIGKEKEKTGIGSVLSVLAKGQDPSSTLQYKANSPGTRAVVEVAGLIPIHGGN